VFGLLACSDRSITRSVLAHEPASGGRPNASTSQVPAADIASAIRAALVDGRSLRSPFTARSQGQLIDLYAAGGFAPLWVDNGGRPNRDARDALALLRAAATEGLDPEDYCASALTALAASLDAVTLQTSEVAAFDFDLSANTLRYLRELHQGRIDPRAIGFRMSGPADDHDFSGLLRSAVMGHRVPGLASDLTPQLALYRALRDALARYRSLAGDRGLQNPPLLATTIRPGQPCAGLDELSRWLVALGDLPARPEAGSSRYEGPIVEGVRHFQSRHGLDPDGVLGSATRSALSIPLAKRVRQIELALERLRWVPDLSQGRLIAVDIPLFRLWAWSSIRPDGVPSFSTGVIVGRALNRQTPVFVDEMRYLIFRPYWNVPSSIAVGEILPALRRDPDYLRRQDMEIVSGQGDDARPVALGAASLAAVRQGVLRIRQRPGPKNALGLVKFVFPNDNNVYLHDTPSPQLFRRSRRDFSHGCVRVENAVALAEWALQGQDEWTRDTILAAMNASESRRVDLARPIQIILFYITVIVTPEDGAVRFAEDLYGHDARLDRALGLDRTSP